MAQRDHGGAVVGVRGEARVTRRSASPRFDSHDSLLDAPIAGTFDLHGMTRLQAEAALRSYLQAATRAHAGKVVHVITGKGRGSAKGSVLRPAAVAVLKGMGPMVAEYDKDVDGGGFLVRLR